MTAPKPVLLGLLLIAVFASNAAAQGETGIHRIPNTMVSGAYLFSRPLGGVADPVMAENALRAFALRESDDVVDRNLAWVRQSAWEAQFKALFARAVTWARAVRGRSAEELYRLSHEFRARPEPPERHFESVAKELLSLAARAGHGKARQEQAEWVRNYERERSPTDSPQLRNRAAEGDSGAMFLLATRYQDRQGVKRSLAKSYYWFLRAGKRGENVAVKILGLDGIASPADKKQALEWLAAGIVPEL